MFPEAWRSMREEDKPHYPHELQAQLEALKTDAQLRDFAAIRKRMQEDPYRPIYHFTRPDGRLNDPNGLCFWQGKWHLFYQAVDRDAKDGLIHWGHAVSEDLIRWKDLPFALYPGVEHDCYSGACYVEENRVIAAYYGYTEKRDCGIMLAESSDPLLLNWKKLNNGRPVIPAPSPDEKKPYATFDAYLWREKETYYLISGEIEKLPVTGRPARCEYLFRSHNLTDWEYLHPFIEGDRFDEPGDDGACPYFLPMGDKHMLLHFSHRRMPKYLVGQYDREKMKFIPCGGGKITSGFCTLTAPSAAPLPDGEAVVLFNMQEARPSPKWREILTLPRKIAPGGAFGDELSFSPAGDIDSLHEAHVFLTGRKLKPGEEHILSGITGNALEMRYRFRLCPGSGMEFRVLRSPGAEEYTRILFSFMTGEHAGKGGMGPIKSMIAIDTTHASLLEDVSVRMPEMNQVTIEREEEIDIRIFLDRSVVEVFVNDRQCVCQRVYPSREDSLGVSLKALGREAEWIGADAWKMKSIWEE